MAIGDNAGSAHVVEGGEGVAEEAVRGVAFDDASPAQGVLCWFGPQDLSVKLFGVPRRNHRVRVTEDVGASGTTH